MSIIKRLLTGNLFLTFQKIFDKIYLENKKGDKTMTLELLRALFTIARFCEK